MRHRQPKFGGVKWANSLKGTNSKTSMEYPRAGIAIPWRPTSFIHFTPLWVSAPSWPPTQWSARFSICSLPWSGCEMFTVPVGHLVVTPLVQSVILLFVVAFTSLVFSPGDRIALQCTVRFLKHLLPADVHKGSGSHVHFCPRPCSSTYQWARLPTHRYNKTTHTSAPRSATGRARRSVVLALSDCVAFLPLPDRALNKRATRRGRSLGLRLRSNNQTSFSHSCPLVG